MNIHLYFPVIFPIGLMCAVGRFLALLSWWLLAALASVGFSGFCGAFVPGFQGLDGLPARLTFPWGGGGWGLVFCAC